jgi:predicted TIM-barrel fold metal-dependent hydrolase
MDHRCLLDTPSEELPSSRFRKAKVYVDCNSFGPRAIEAAVSLYGAERIVCGTDGTEFGCDWTRKALAEAQIGEEAREKILQRNAAAMLARAASAAPRELAAD